MSQSQNAPKRRNERGSVFNFRLGYEADSMVQAIKNIEIGFGQLRDHCQDCLSDYVPLIKRSQVIMARWVEDDKFDEWMYRRSGGWFWKAMRFITRQCQTSEERKRQRDRAHAARYAVVKKHFFKVVQSLAAMRKLGIHLRMIKHGIISTRGIHAGETLRQRRLRKYESDLVQAEYGIYLEEAMDEVERHQKNLQAEYDETHREGGGDLAQARGRADDEIEHPCTHTNFWPKQGDCEECVHVAEAKSANPIVYWCPGCAKRACAACQRLLVPGEPCKISDIRQPYSDVFIAAPPKPPKKLWYL